MAVLNLGQHQTLIANFVTLTMSIFTKTRDYINGNPEELSASNAVALLKISDQLAAAGVNAMNTLRSSLNLTYQEDRYIASALAAYENMRGYLIEISQVQEISDYTDLLSSSGGASIVGGSSISQYQTENPFDVMFGNPLSVQYSSDAMNSILFLQRMDTVLSPIDLTELTHHLNQIVRGFDI